MEHTNYVMVPVPEQHVTRVMQHVLHLTLLDKETDWEQDELTDVFASFPEDRKAVVALSASAIDSGREVTADAIAEKLELPLSHVMQVIRDLAEIARERAHPQLVQVRMTTSRSPSGREIKLRSIEVDPTLAKMLLEAEEADRRSSGQDGLGG